MQNTDEKKLSNVKETHATQPGTPAVTPAEAKEKVKDLTKK